MLKKLTLAALLLAPAAAHAQNAVSPYVFADTIAARLRAQPGQNQQVAWQYAAIGRYQAALEAFTKGPAPAAPRR
ncbi:MAG: hypothetical protein EOO59_16325 [Hymenobacter sp.]|nr:MAG: hypothetical protein EOO59_16325 [Hymenobacter sp.]